MEYVHRILSQSQTERKMRKDSSVRLMSEAFFFLRKNRVSPKIQYAKTLLPLSHKYGWMCLDVFGCVWMCLDVFGYASIWDGCVWMCLDVFGYVWMFAKHIQNSSRHS